MHTGGIPGGWFSVAQVVLLGAHIGIVCSMDENNTKGAVDTAGREAKALTYHHGRCGEAAGGG